MARQFERFRAALHELWPWARIDPGSPITVYAARNEASLRRLLPAFWEGRGARPAGVFLAGRGRSYVALRTDVPVPRPGQGNPFHVPYHEYVHLVLDLNFAGLPAWLHEGLAEFLGATVIREDVIELGTPIPSHLFLLRERKLLPTADLFRIERFSADYSEGDRATVFYAQSWALVHYLMQDERAGQGRRISEYLRLRAAGVDDPDATRRALGDPGGLHRAVEGYVRGLSFAVRRLSVPPDAAGEPSKARELGASEVLTARAALLLVADRRDEARALFEKALELDPGDAAAREGLRAEGERAPGPPSRSGPDDPDPVLERRCESGAVGDCVELGERYRMGKGRPAEPGKAAGLFVMACAAGERQGCAREGWAYEFGEGVARDPARAAAAYTRGCDLEHGWSCTRLAFLSEIGQGLPPDPARASALYARACEGGFAPGCTGLGAAHVNRGTAAELEQGASWLRRACDGGDPPGCALLAALHEAGQGVPRDPARAAELYKKACDAGLASSCERLGAMRP